MKRELELEDEEHANDDGRTGDQAEVGPLAATLSAGDAAVSPRLRAMVEELRAEEPPQRNWDEIERGILRRIARSESGRHERSGSHVFRQLAPIAAFAAAITLAINFGARSGGEPADPLVERHPLNISGVALAPGASEDPGERDLSALRPGDVIETAGAPVTFARAGVLRWTLAPASRAVVRFAGAPVAAQAFARSMPAGIGMVMALEQGSIRAEVEPRAPSEGLIDAFAVEVDGTRVAVHGTAFTVTHFEQSILVDVQHGVVVIGPAGHRGATAGYSLVGPSRASFSLDGTRTARLLPPPLAGETHGVSVGAEAVIAPPIQPSQPASAVASREMTTPQPIGRSERASLAGQGAIAAAAPVSALPTSKPVPIATRGAEADADADNNAAVHAPPPRIVRLTPESVKASIERCIKDTQSARSSSVNVSIASTLHITVRGDGTVEAAQLTPPLAPHLRSCADVGIAGQFANGPQSLSIPLRAGPSPHP